MDKVGCECFEVESRFSNFYSGDQIEWSENGKHLYCQKSSKINILSTDTGEIIGSLNLCEEKNYENDILLTFDVSKDNKIITAHKSGLIKLWNLCNSAQLKKWKSNHSGPISTIRFRHFSQTVSSTGSDSTIRVWDSTNSCSICIIKEQGTISLVSFYPEASTPFLYATGYDSAIRCWNYSTGKCLNVYKGHISFITSIAFDESNFEYMASVSVDKVLILWNLHKSTQFKVLPLYESLRGVFFLTGYHFRISSLTAVKPNELLAVVVSVTGKLYVINCMEMKVVHTTYCTNFYSDKFNNTAVSHLLFCKEINQFLLVNDDHTILFFDICTLQCSKRLIGYSKEILDLCFIGDNNQYLAVATNNITIKIYDVSNMNCTILSEHVDTVLTLAGLKNYLFSAGKDLIIVIWKLDPKVFTIKCIGKCVGHTSAIGSISLTCQSLSMFGSVSQDGCLKLWISSKVCPNKIDTELSFKLKNSIKAHEKAVNCITFSPNNSVVATASQDKNIKIWECKNLNLVATLCGHQRGVWSVRFSPVDQILLSSSSDCSIRIWSLSTLTCISKIDEEYPILRVEFITQGKQFLSASAKGMIKVWNIHSTVCLCALDEHEDHVWALAVTSKGSCFFSGGSDKNLIYWKDKKTTKTDNIKKEQFITSQKYKLLSNYIKNKNSEKALPLSLLLNKPLICLDILKNLIRQRSSYTLPLTHLNNNQVDSLHILIKSWNTNTSYCKLSQFILSWIINEASLHRKEIQNHVEYIEGIHLYSEKHYRRISSYVKDINFLDFTVNCM